MSRTGSIYLDQAHNSKMIYLLCNQYNFKEEKYSMLIVYSDCKPPSSNDFFSFYSNFILFWKILYAIWSVFA